MSSNTFTTKCSEQDTIQLYLDSLGLWMQSHKPKWIMELNTM